MAGPLNRPAPPTGASPDRPVKIALLTASLLTLAFLIAAMVRENFFSPWRFHQRAYRETLLTSTDEPQRQLGNEFEVRIRQIDCPQFGTTDRCVSCHVGLDNPAMAGAPLPQRVHSGDHLKYHPVAKYGCTICHQGQGAATSFHEARSTDAYWDYPLLPRRLTQASCGTCHAADSSLMAQHAPRLAQGRRLFLERGCQSCHKLDGVGGQLGPALDGEGRKVKHQLPMAHLKGDRTLPNWLQEHFENPQRIVPGSQMRPPRLTATESEALTIYMLSLAQRNIPQTYLPADRIAALDAELHHREMRPDVLYGRFCVNCHGDGTHGVYDRFFHRFMPAIRGPGVRAVADDAYLRQAIEQGRPGTLMPAWHRQAGGLTAAQVDALVKFLKDGDGRPPQPLSAVAVGHGDAARGAELFAQACAGCHGANRLAPSLANAVFQKTASDALILQTIAGGRIDTAMPAFRRDGADGLSENELRELLAYVRSLGAPRTAAGGEERR